MHSIGYTGPYHQHREQFYSHYLELATSKIEFMEMMKRSGLRIDP